MLHIITIDIPLCTAHYKIISTERVAKHVRNVSPVPDNTLPSLKPYLSLSQAVLILIPMSQLLIAIIFQAGD